MRVLSIGFDKKLLLSDSESQKRLIAYGKLCDQLKIIVVTPGQHPVIQLSDRVSVYPTNSGFGFAHAFKVLKLSREIIKQEQIDVIVVQDPLVTGLLGLALAVIYRKKLLVGIFGSNIIDPKLKKTVIQKALRPLGLLVLNAADAIQTDGIEIFDAIKTKFPNKIFLKPMVPADIDRFRKLERSFQDKPKVLYIGRMSEQKNIPLLADIIGESLKRQPDISFTIVGNGPLAENFSRKLINSGASGQVQCQLNVNRDEMTALFQSHNILVLTSHYEGFPRVFMEAAATGMPIVTTAVGGARNLVVEGETGFIVPQGEKKMFVDKLLYLYNTPELLKNMSESIRRVFDDKLSFEVNLRQQAAVFEYLKNLK